MEIWRRHLAGAHQRPVMGVEDKVTQSRPDMMGLLFLKIQNFIPVETGWEGEGRASRLPFYLKNQSCWDS